MTIIIRISDQCVYAFGTVPWIYKDIYFNGIHKTVYICWKWHIDDAMARPSITDSVLFEKRGAEKSEMYKETNDCMYDPLTYCQNMGISKTEPYIYYVYFSKRLSVLFDFSAGLFAIIFLCLSCQAFFMFTVYCADFSYFLIQTRSS